MPFYFRKSVNAGPFRFNFSKGGVGVSVGVKGIRVGSGPRGHYVHAGRGGIYYRSTIGGKAPLRSSVPASSTSEWAAANYDEPNVAMIRVLSGDVLEMHDSAL